MRDSVRLCCCYEFFHFCLRERKCAFPVRGGSWINSALSAFILNALLINADKGYAAARLAARLTDGPKVAVAFIGRLRLETEGRRSLSVSVWWQRGKEEGERLLTSTELVVCCCKEGRGGGGQSSRGREKERRHSVVSG